MRRAARFILHFPRSLIAKAAGDVKNNPNLVLRTIVDKRGNVTKRYVDPSAQDPGSQGGLFGEVAAPTQEGEMKRPSPGPKPKAAPTPPPEPEPEPAAAPAESEAMQQEANRAVEETYLAIANLPNTDAKMAAREHLDAMWQAFRAHDHAATLRHAAEARKVARLEHHELNDITEGAIAIIRDADGSEIDRFEYADGDKLRNNIDRDRRDARIPEDATVELVGRLEGAAFEDQERAYGLMRDQLERDPIFQRVRDEDPKLALPTLNSLFEDMTMPGGWLPKNHPDLAASLTSEQQAEILDDLHRHFQAVGRNVGEEKVENGVRYRLNENHRWERVDDERAEQLQVVRDLLEAYGPEGAVRRTAQAFEDREQAESLITEAVESVGGDDTLTNANRKEFLRRIREELDYHYTPGVLYKEHARNTYADAGGRTRDAVDFRTQYVYASPLRPLGSWASRLNDGQRNGDLEIVHTQNGAALREKAHSYVVSNDPLDQETIDAYELQLVQEPDVDPPNEGAAANRDAKGGWVIEPSAGTPHAPSWKVKVRREHYPEDVLGHYETREQAERARDEEIREQRRPKPAGVRVGDDAEPTWTTPARRADGQHRYYNYAWAPGAVIRERREPDGTLIDRTALTTPEQIHAAYKSHALQEDSIAGRSDRDYNDTAKANLRDADATIRGLLEAAERAGINDEAEAGLDAIALARKRGVRMAPKTRDAKNPRHAGLAQLLANAASFGKPAFGWPGEVYVKHGRRQWKHYIAQGHWAGDESGQYVMHAIVSDDAAHRKAAKWLEDEDGTPDPRVSLTGEAFATFAKVAADQKAERERREAEERRKASGAEERERYHQAATALARQIEAEYDEKAKGIRGTKSTFQVSYGPIEEAKRREQEATLYPKGNPLVAIHKLPGNSKTSPTYAVSHVPTGLQMVVGYTMAEARRAMAAALEHDLNFQTYEEYRDRPQAFRRKLGSGITRAMRPSATSVTADEVRAYLGEPNPDDVAAQDAFDANFGGGDDPA